MSEEKTDEAIEKAIEAGKQEEEADRKIRAIDRSEKMTKFNDKFALGLTIFCSVLMINEFLLALNVNHGYSGLYMYADIFIVGFFGIVLMIQAKFVSDDKVKKYRMTGLFFLLHWVITLGIAAIVTSLAV